VTKSTWSFKQQAFLLEPPVGGLYPQPFCFLLAHTPKEGMTQCFVCSVAHHHGFSTSTFMEKSYVDVDDVGATDVTDFLTIAMPKLC
jgi:hypothetical protein